MAFEEAAAPKVTVPADFGIERLGDPNHSNLEFIMRDGLQILANSVIVSLNSPVLENMITELNLKSIDVSDFHDDTVHCFLEGCYTGRLQKINKDIFRDVSKMAHVFKVEWMEERCRRYFHYLAENIPEKFEYKDLLFLFEEACYAERRFKNEALLDEIVTKYASSATYRKCFVSQYLRENSGQISEKQLKAVLGVGQRQPKMLILFVIEQLKTNKSHLSKEAKYFLSNINLSRCFRKNPELKKELIDYLGLIEKPSPEDYKLVLSLYKSCNTAIEKYSSLPNLFNSFKTINKLSKFEELLTFLSTSEDVESFSMFFEGLFCWLFNHANSNSKLPENFDESLLAVKSKRNWKNVSSHLVEMFVVDGERSAVFQSLKESIINCHAMSSEGYEYVTSTLDYSWDELLLKDNDIEFVASKTKLNPIEGPCTESGECGFIIHVTPSSEENCSSFNIQLLQDPDAYPAHMHLHEDFVSSKNMHFVLEMTFSGKKRLFPVSWYGKPDCNVNGSIWKWGAIYFIDKGEIPLGFPDESIDWRWGLGRLAKIRLAVFISNSKD